MRLHVPNMMNATQQEFLRADLLRNLLKFGVSERRLQLLREEEV